MVGLFPMDSPFSTASASSTVTKVSAMQSMRSVPEGQLVIELVSVPRMEK